MKVAGKYKGQLNRKNQAHGKGNFVDDEGNTYSGMF